MAWNAAVHHNDSGDYIIMMWLSLVAGACAFMIGSSDAFVPSFSGAVLQKPSARLDSKVMQPYDTSINSTHS